MSDLGPACAAPGAELPAAPGGVVLLEVRRTGKPARNLPAGMWFDVLGVLRAHGLDPDALDVVMALGEVILATPVERGGRLRPDGTTLPVEDDTQPDEGAER